MQSRSVVVMDKLQTKKQVDRKEPFVDVLDLMYFLKMDVHYGCTASQHERSHCIRNRIE